MEIHFSPDVEAKLNSLAAASGKSTDDLVQSLVTERLSYEPWFQGEVEKGLASLDRGEHVSHDEVGRRLERSLRS